MPNHQNNFATNLTSTTAASDTTSPLSAIPSAAAPFYIAFDATNMNGHYEVKQITSKTATNVLHSALSYDHTTDEEVRMIVPAEEMDTLATGWQAAPGTWTYATADSPTFTLTTSLDMSSFIGVGTRIKLTQTTVKYFIVTAISGTTITLYGGTDYTLTAAAITLPYFSIMKSPIGFPLDPTKWTVKVSDTTERAQASPVQNTWYNPGSTNQQISVPIGAWRLGYKTTAGSGGHATVGVTLSNANNTESDAEFTTSRYETNSSGTVDFYIPHVMEKEVVAASKTTYYLNIRTTTSGVSTIRTNSGAGSHTMLKAVRAYL